MAVSSKSEHQIRGVTIQLRQTYGYFRSRVGDSHLERLIQKDEKKRSVLSLPIYEMTSIGKTVFGFQSSVVLRWHHRPIHRERRNQMPSWPRHTNDEQRGVMGDVDRCTHPSCRHSLFWLEEPFVLREARPSRLGTARSWTLFAQLMT